MGDTGRLRSRSCRPSTLDHIDAYAARPATVPDEEFHLAVTELLEKWARSNLPRPEVMRVVGEEWSARSHEIRDLLSRNVIPFGFYPASSRPGRALLEQAGAAAATLPVVIMFDGRVLEDPSNTQLAEAIGMRTSPGDGLYDVAVIGAGPAWRPRSTGRPRACPRWCWSRRPSAARPARVRASATTSASRPG